MCRRPDDAPKGQMLPRFGRPVVADSTDTHTCVAEYVSSKLHPTFNCYKGFADQVLLRAYTCILQTSGLQYTRALQTRSLEGCTQGPRVTRVARVRPTTCCCEHTKVLQNKSSQGCTRGSKYYNASADQVLLQAYICVLQNDKTQGFTQGSTVTRRFGRPPAAAGTHMCVAE